MARLLLPYLNYEQTLALFGQFVPSYPVNVPCPYCSQDAVLVLDHILDSVVVACDSCSLSFSLFEFLAFQKGFVEEINPEEMVDVINGYGVFRTKITATDVINHFDRLTEFQNFNILLDKLKRAFYDASVGISQIMVVNWNINPPDEVHWSKVDKHFFPILTSDLKGILGDVDLGVRDRVTIVIPFYSSPYRPCGILIFGLKFAHYFSTISQLRGAGLGGNPNVYQGRKFHKLLDDYDFYFDSPEVYLETVSTILSGTNVIPSASLLYKGIGYVANRKTFIETFDIPVTGRAPAFLCKLSKHTTRLMLESGGMYLDDKAFFKPRNRIKGLIDSISQSRNGNFLLKFLKAKYGYHNVRDVEAVIALEEQKNAITSLQKLKNAKERINAVLNRELLIKDRLFKLNDFGILLGKSHVANYIPLLQTILKDAYIFEVYHAGNIIKAIVNKSDKKSRVIANLERTVNEKTPHTIITSTKAFSSYLFAIAEKLGRCEQAEYQPKVNPGSLRLRSCLLRFKHDPALLFDIDTGLDTSFSLYFSESEFTQHPLSLIVAGIALALIPVFRMQLATPFDIVVENKEVAKLLYSTSRRLGFYRKILPTIDNLALLYNNKILSSWITLVRLKEVKDDIPLMGGFTFLNQEMVDYVWEKNVLLLDIPALDLVNVDNFKHLFYNLLVFIIKECAPFSNLTYSPVVLVSNVLSKFMEKYQIKGNAFDIAAQYVKSLRGKWKALSQAEKVIRAILKKRGYKGSSTLPLSKYVEIISESDFPESLILISIKSMLSKGLLRDSD